MTLNLTLAARWMIVQTSDFRLTVAPRPPEETAQKQFVLRYAAWAGLLCYSGIARYHGHDTAQWLTALLTHTHGEQRSAQQIADLIANEGTPWLSRVDPTYRLHTFTLAAFIRDKPVVHMISNYQRAGHIDLAQPLDHFIVTRHRPTSPRLHITGWWPAVDQRDQDHLVDVLRSERDPLALRRAAANVNRRSAPRSSKMVGENCVAAHMLPDGSGEAQVFGQLTEQFVPTMILSGENVAAHVPAGLDAAGATTPHRLVGATWTANHPHQRAFVLAFRDVNNLSGDPGWET